MLAKKCKPTYEELVFTLKLMVDMLALWPGIQNPELFDCMKHARKVLDRLQG